MTPAMTSLNNCCVEGPFVLKGTRLSAENVTAIHPQTVETFQSKQPRDATEGGGSVQLTETPICRTCRS